MPDTRVDGGSFYREPVGLKEDDRPVERGERVTASSARPVTRSAGPVRYESGAHDISIPEAYNLPKDRVRWGPIWAGLVTAMTSLLLLSLLGAALGLAGLDAGRTAVQGVPPPDTARNAAMGAFGGSLVALGASALGGFLGTRRELEVDGRAGDPRES